MKSTFPEYFDSDVDRLKDLWDTAIVVFDTNCLLDFYRLGETTVRSYFQAFESVSDRLWLPYQVDFEYSKNRREVVEKQIADLSKYEAVMKSVSEFLDSHCLSYMNGVPGVASEIKEKILALEPLLKQGRKTYREHCLTVDKRLDKLFGSHIATRPAKLDELTDEAEQRCKRKQPPGYMDAKKDSNPYGDAILWLEMLRSTHERLIFVTKDRKEDWWLDTCGTHSPRPELIREMREKGKEFYLYSFETFMRHALSSLPKEDKPTDDLIDDAVNEAKTPPLAEEAGPTVMSFYDTSARIPSFRRIPIPQPPNAWWQSIEDCIARLLSVIRHLASEYRLDTSSISDPLDYLTLLCIARIVPVEFADEVRGKIAYMRLRLTAGAPIESDELSNLVGWTDYACGRLRMGPLI